MSDISRKAQEVAVVVANMAELMTPLFEAAKGVRESMIAEGWSPTAAEQTAQQMLSLWLAKVMG